MAWKGTGTKPPAPIEQAPAPAAPDRDPDMSRVQLRSFPRPGIEPNRLLYSLRIRLANIARTRARIRNADQRRK